jgi:hypothetical protein
MEPYINKFFSTRWLVRNILKFTDDAVGTPFGEEFDGRRRRKRRRRQQDLSGKLTVIVNSGVFTNEVVTGAISGETLTVTSITTPTYVVDVSSIWYSVSSGAMVGLEWGNSTPSFASFTMLSGNGFLSKQNLPCRFAPAVTGPASPNGNLYVSTYGVGIKGGYHIVLDLHKEAGFSQRPVY